MTEEKTDAVPPASSAQRRLRYAEKIENSGTPGNAQVVFRLRGDLDVQLLELVIATVLKRHESLRTTFSAGPDGDLLQQVYPVTPFRLLVRELDADEPDRDASAAAWAERSRCQGFDPDNGPLFRASLLRVRPAESHLALDLHHLVADVCSFGVIYRELCALYSAGVDNATALPEVPNHYGDLVRREHGWHSEAQGDLAASLEAWRRRLADVPPATVFPADRPRGAASSAGRTSLAELPAGTMAGVRGLSDSTGASTFMILLTAFKSLLARYSGETDLVVGSAVTGRTRPEIENLVGRFVNPVVLRTDFGGGPTFNEALDRVRHVVLHAYENQRVPLDRLADELRPDQDAARQPFFQTLLQYADVTLAPDHVGAVDIDMVGFSSGEPGVDLAVSIIENANGTIAAWEYNGDLFGDATINRFQKHFATLLAAAVASPDTRVDELPLSDDADRARLTAPAVTRSGTGAASLHRAVERWARTAPESVALFAGDDAISYGELNTRANRLARALRRHGVTRESVVGVRVHRGPLLPLLLLAILKSGGTYLPVDPDLPADRQAYMVTDAGAALVVGEQIANLPAEQIMVGPLLDQAAGCDGGNLDFDDPAGAAYVIYTSGSTGRPKGVEVLHGGLANVIEAQRAAFDLRPDDRVGQFFSPSFDASIFEIAMAFGAGCALVVTDPQQILPGDPLAQAFHASGVTAVTMTPSALLALGAVEIPSLRLVCAAGEACPSAALDPWARQARCFNLYGPTETTIWATTHAIDDMRDSTVPIGVPIPNTTAYLLDDRLAPVPELIVGELYIGGAGVSRGYLGRPALTADRFVPDPFAAQPGARMYRTGDLARRRSDGVIEFVGRSDDQVKIRGYRIELGEVEHAILLSPLVRSCAAVAESSGGGGGADRLVCYLVPSAPGVGVADKVRAFAAARLPDYLVPDRIVVRDALPVLSNGKVDRRALAAIEFNHDDGESDTFIAPSSPMEELVAGLWQAALSVPRVGLMDDFFELGGHSLAAALLVSRLSSALNLDVPVTLLFEYRSLGEYCAALSVLATGKGTPAAS